MNGRTRVRTLSLLAAGALSLAGLAACSNGPDPARTAAEVTVAATTAGASTTPSTAAPASSALSADEVSGLVWMREEEQLAHDVYVALDQQWDVRAFANIASSETTHLEAVAALLDRYAIADPALTHQAGRFSDARIQALYDELMVAGRASLVDALKVGARIEEIDIVDLQTREAASNHADILAVYANLEKGSRNHLRAFTSQLASRGVTYAPTTLATDAYAAIVAGSTERGPEG